MKNGAPTAAIIMPTGISVGGTRIAIGEMLDLRLPKYVCSGECIQMYEINAEDEQ